MDRPHPRLGTRPRVETNELSRIKHKNALLAVYWDLVPRAPERETRASQPQLHLVALFTDQEVQVSQ